jgi:hypothetical protein
LSSRIDVAREKEHRDHQETTTESKTIHKEKGTEGKDIRIVFIKKSKFCWFLTTNKAIDLFSVGILLIFLLFLIASFVYCSLSSS